MSGSRDLAPDPSRFRFWTEQTLRFADTDLNGHINNSVFAVMCEAGRVDLLFQALGEAGARDYGLVIARLAIDFRAEMHYPGVVRIGTAARRLGTSSITLFQGLYGPKGCVATSEAVVVLLNKQTRRPLPIPDDARARFLALAPWNETAGEEAGSAA